MAKRHYYFSIFIEREAIMGVSPIWFEWMVMFAAQSLLLDWWNNSYLQPIWEYLLKLAVHNFQFLKITKLAVHNFQFFTRLLSCCNRNADRKVNDTSTELNSKLQRMHTLWKNHVSCLQSFDSSFSFQPFFPWGARKSSLVHNTHFLWSKMIPFDHILCNLVQRLSRFQCLWVTKKKKTLDVREMYVFIYYIKLFLLIFIKHYYFLLNSHSQGVIYFNKVFFNCIK